MPDHTPPPFDHRRLLMGAPSPSRRQVALAAGLSVGIAAVIATLIGEADHALFVSLGAFAALYGTDRPYRYRARLLTLVVLLLLATVILGALTQDLSRAFGAVAGEVSLAGLIVIAGVTVLATLTTFLANALQLGPPGGFFFAMVASMGALLSGRGIGVGELALLTLLGGVTALVISLLPALWAPHGPVAARLRAVEGAMGRHLAAVESGGATSRTRTDVAVALHGAWNAIAEARMRDSATSRALHARHAQFARTLAPRSDPEDVEDQRIAVDIPLGLPNRRYLFFRAFRRGTLPMILSTRVLIACAVAGTAAYLLETGRPDWALMSAILVLHSGVDRLIGTYKALHRLIGTVAGLLVFTLVYALNPQGYLLIAVLAVLQWAIELLVVRQYAAAVTLITPLVLLVTTLPGQNPAELMWARFIDTLIGVAVGVVVLWTTGRGFWRSALPGQLDRVEAATSRLGDLLAATGPGSRESLEARRDLQFELNEAVQVAVAAYRNAPSLAGPHWARHLTSQDDGYRLLASCWASSRP